MDAADVAVVYSGGSVGNCAVAALHAMGALIDSGAEPLDYKREIGRKIGTDTKIDQRRRMWRQKVRKHSRGLRADNKRWNARERRGNGTDTGGCAQCRARGLH